jgi:hypothetical protein
MKQTFLTATLLMACTSTPKAEVDPPQIEGALVLSGEDFHGELGDETSPEVCDGEDNDGDGEIDEGLLISFYLDADNDGWGDEPIEACTPPPGYSAISGDCDDADPNIHPDAEEVCDAKDNDCNGLTDEGLTQTFWADLDGDGYGDPSVAITACSMPDDYTNNANDCDDSSSIISPMAIESCNGSDDDCDGRIDEGVGMLLYPDDDGDGFGVTGAAVTSCWDLSGHSSMPGDCDDGDAAIHPEADEVCDGVDNDCDDLVDIHAVGGTVRYWADLDGDGHGDGPAIESCAIPDGFSATDDDCDDTDPTRAPSLPELCNGIDDNCDGSIDEGLMSAFYIDADADGFGAGLPVYSCEAPSGTAATATDCDDGHGGVYPGAAEFCDGLDNDCNSVIDDAPIDGTIYFGDADGDGYGDPAISISACVTPFGYVDSSTDCDPSRAATYPGALELCDGLDNDCNGSIDDDVPDAPTWYADDDDDGHGDGMSSVSDCVAPPGMVASSDDCDDDDEEVHPGATELCNHIDDDCDGSIDDDAADRFPIYQDNDDDGYGSETSILSCELSDGWAFEGGDCDDDDDDIHPGAKEDCDGQDQDCDGVVDNDADDCPCVQRNYGSNSYLFCQTDEEWNQAKNECDDFDYDLVTINAWPEQNWLIETISEDPDIANEPYWTGLNDRDHERHSSRSGWVWQSGEDYIYESWADHQPDNWWGEDCVEINRWPSRSVDNNWNDSDCDEQIHFVCEASP